MSDTDFNIPESLKQALKSKQVVSFIGAGVSMSVKKKNDDGTQSSESLFPSWKGFVEILAQALRGEQKPNEADYVLSSIKIKKPKYLDALQHAQQELGESLWYKLFDESFDIPESKAHRDSLKLNELIWKLSNNLIITTNVDRVFQWTCPQFSEFRLLDVQNVEYARLQNEQIPKRPTVWYLHGHIDNKEKVIFTREQFEAFYKQRDNDAKLQTLLSFLTQRTFLFIGFSLDDAYLREQLEYIHNIYKGGADSFYILLHKDEIGKANLSEYVKPIPFSGFGEPLEDLVAELVRIAQSGDGTGKDKSGDDMPKTSADSKPDVKKPFFNVPYKSKGDEFVGRVGKIEEIWESLNRSGRASIGQAVTISGFGGLGKTQLAVEYAHVFRRKYKNGVFWLTADEDIDIQLLKIGEDLSWISQFDKGFDQAEFVRNRFRKLSDCLIIFDNVDSQDEIKNYLPEIEYQPHILVTSRDEQYGFYPINLDVLSLDESRALLTQISNRSFSSKEERESLENILQILDGLPLAVELVGGYLLRRKNITFQDYHNYLNNESIEQIEKKFPNNPFTKRDTSIIRALKISEKLFNETEYLEDILNILAWSGKSSMGYSLLQELVGTNDNHTLQDALGVALELHFIKQEETSERYAIHRLLAKVRQFEKPLKQEKEWHYKIVSSLENWFKNKNDEGKVLTEAELEFDHLETWQKQTLDYLPSEAIWLTLLKSNPLTERGNYKEAKKYTLEAFELYEKENLTNKALLVSLYYSMSNTMSDSGQFKEAKNLIEKALDLYRDNFLNDKKLLINLIAFLGGMYSELESHSKALEFQQQVFEMERELFTGNHFYLANSLNNIGVTYGYLGDHQKALEFKQKGLNMNRKLFSEKHPAIASALNNLGVTYNDLGDSQIALQFQKEALEMRQELFGKIHPSVANSYTNIGSVYLKLNKNQIAVECIEKGLQIYREVLGNQHPLTVSAGSNLIVALLKAGNSEKGKRLSIEFFGYAPQNHPDWKWLEEISRPYRLNKKRHKKRLR